MTKIHIEASSPYDVTVEAGLLDRLGTESAKLVKPGKTVLVSGKNVNELYGDRAAHSLERAGFEVLRFVHESGEKAKSLETYGELQSFLCKNRVSRTDTLFALGGGVTGDLTGFAAATYQRGMNYVQVPTSLLAAVDSSVGGKTAVNLPEGKNQVGCFYQPRAVFCDVELLKTLPEREYRCGCAEIIKYAVLGDKELFAELEKENASAAQEKIISRCIEMKSKIVCLDEYDNGERRLLNLGHTIGHAAEKCSGFGISHGEGVAMGMAAVTEAAVKNGICSREDGDRICALIKKYGLPTQCPYPEDMLYDACLSDKKISDGFMHLVIPETIGRCRIIKIEPEELRDRII